MATEKKKVKPLGTDLPIELVDEFSEWVKVRKLIRSEVSAVALRLIMRLPLGLSDIVLRERWEEVDALLKLADQSRERLNALSAEDAADHHEVSLSAENSVGQRKRQTRA